MTKRRIKKVIKRIIELVLVFSGLSLVSKIFGQNNAITNFYKEKVVFTPYNIVGLILISLSVLNVWVGKKKSSKLLSVVTFLLSAAPAVSFCLNFLNYFSEQKNIEVENKVDYGFECVNIIAGIILTILVVWIIYLVVHLFKSIKNRQLLNEEENEDKTCVKKEETKSKFKIYLQKEKEILEQIKNEQTQKILKAIKNKVEYKIGNRICPKCGAELKNRQNGQDGRWFIGCDNYFVNIECRFTYDYHDFKRYEELYDVRDDILLERYKNGKIKIDLEF